MYKKQKDGYAVFSYTTLHFRRIIYHKKTVVSTPAVEINPLCHRRPHHYLLKNEIRRGWWINPLENARFRIASSNPPQPIQI